MHKYRSLILPFAIVFGLIFHQYIALAKNAVPFLIFFILMFNFSSLEVRKLKLTGMHYWLLLFQIVVSLLFYFILLPANEIIAQGVLVGILSPVAASVVVIACMLGADRSTITAYTLLGNAGIAIVAPIYFSFIGANMDMPFMDSFGLILSKITPIIVLPLVVIIVLQFVAPKANHAIAKLQGISFYLWAMALMITISQTIDFIYRYGAGNESVIIWLSIASLIGCAIQFAVGRWVGKKYGDSIAGGQALGQRNTAMAIWMAYTYLNPLASIFPAAYSIWQNLFNSYQLWKHDKRVNQTH